MPLDWIDTILSKTSPLFPNDDLEADLINFIVDTCKKHQRDSNKNIGYLYAASFDLLVAAQYYSTVSHSDWLYCPSHLPKIFFHYTNCCPRCVLSENFVFSPSNKPTSGKIGSATSRLLLLFLQAILKEHGRSEEVLKGSEPVDAIVINRKLRKVLFAEIKASPLLTPSIAANSQKLTEDVEGEIVEREHSTVDNINLFSSNIEIAIPILASSGKWSMRFFLIGQRQNTADKLWGYRGILSLLRSDRDFFPCYFNFWENAFNSYFPKQNRSIFWLTNACGTPSPVPHNWKRRRRGSGYESISDSKSSVGMDRTDDIKKGIYQVLKLGSQGKPIPSSWDYKVGLLSNVHAARHFKYYLESLKDIVWTIDRSKVAKKVSDLPSEQDIYNLFDGIIAFTQINSRDEWIDTIFQFQEVE